MSWSDLEAMTPMPDRFCALVNTYNMLILAMVADKLKADPSWVGNTSLFQKAKYTMVMVMEMENLPIDIEHVCFISKGSFTSLDMILLGVGKISITLSIRQGASTSPLS